MLFNHGIHNHVHIHHIHGVHDSVQPQLPSCHIHICDDHNHHSWSGNDSIQARHQLQQQQWAQLPSCHSHNHDDHNLHSGGSGSILAEPLSCHIHNHDHIHHIHGVHDSIQPQL